MPHPRVSVFRPRCLARGAAALILGGLGSPPPARGHGDVHERIEALSVELVEAGATPERLLRRAGLYRLHGDVDRALADLDAAATLDPQLPQIDLLRGALLADAGRPADALAALNRFLQLSPDDTEALLHRARLHARLSDSPAAAADYDRLLATMTHATPDLFLERAEALLGTDAPDLAAVLRGLDQGMATLGPIPSLQNRAIDLDIRRGDYPAALARLQTLIDRSPKNAQVLLRKGDLLQMTGEADLSLAVYRDALLQVEMLPPARRATPDTQALATTLRQRLAAAVLLPEP